MLINDLSIFSHKTQLKTDLKGIFAGYRNTKHFKNVLPFPIRFKKLYLRYKSKAGRNCSGSVVVRTKSSLKTKFTRPILNYSFRSLKVGFTSSIFLIPFRNLFISLFQLSDGSYTYIPATTNSKLFVLTRIKSLISSIASKTLLEDYLSLTPKYWILNSLHIIRSLPKNQHVCLVEIYPGKGIQYVRAAGSKAKIIKMDTRINTAVVKLPSGVRKIFSIYSLGSLGSVLNPTKTNFKNNKAGYYRNYGCKPTVRGVAMNPVDHPHGGRTKSIKYPRSPWGKTTKFK